MPVVRMTTWGWRCDLCDDTFYQPTKREAVRFGRFHVRNGHLGGKGWDIVKERKRRPAKGRK